MSDPFNNVINFRDGWHCDLPEEAMSDYTINFPRHGNATLLVPMICAKCGKDLNLADLPVADIRTGHGFDSYECHSQFFKDGE